MRPRPVESRRNIQHGPNDKGGKTSSTYNPEECHIQNKYTWNVEQLSKQRSIFRLLSCGYRGEANCFSDCWSKKSRTMEVCKSNCYKDKKSKVSTRTMNEEKKKRNENNLLAKTRLMRKVSDISSGRTVKSSSKTTLPSSWAWRLWSANISLSNGFE